MEIKLEWEHFKSPNLEIIKVFNKKYSQVKEVKLHKIKTRYEVYDPGIEIKNNDLIFYSNIDLGLIHDLHNHIGISVFYLQHLWFYNSIKPNRFKGGAYTATSIYYETFYEALYSKLSSSFDRFLHLVDIYYALGLPKNKVDKNNVKKKLCELYEDHALSTMFDNIIRNSNLINISKIRNSFIHRKSVFEKDLNSVNCKDTFQYYGKIHSAVNHFINYINFLNDEAIPFLYKFKDFNKKH